MADVVAAGGVVWRRSGQGVEILLVHRPRYDDWSLPKGKLDPGEAAVDAAIREVGEETGQAVALGVALGVVGYEKATAGGGHWSKEVHYWAMEHAGGRFVPNHEVDEIAWLPPAEARSRASYGLDREVIDRFLWVTGNA